MAPLHPSDSHTNTHSCHYCKNWLQNIISGVPGRAGAKLAIVWIQNPQTGPQIRLNRAALVFIWMFWSILPLLFAVRLRCPLLTMASFHFFTVLNLSSLIHSSESPPPPSLRWVGIRRCTSPGPRVLDNQRRCWQSLLAAVASKTATVTCGAAQHQQPGMTPCSAPDRGRTFFAGLPKS